MSRGASRWGFVVVVLALSVVIASFVTAADSSGGGKPAAQAAGRAPQSLPDWSGWWYLELAPTETPGARHFMKAPFRPEVAAKIKAVNAAREPASSDESGTLKTLQCQPPRFAGFSGGFVEDIEFLFSPGRVTVLNESGLMRRIFTGAERPDEAEDTNNGVSTGHWEGNTLVVETHSMNPDARFGPNWPGVPKIGRNVRVQERVSLRNANTLEIAVRMEAPDLFTSPFSTTFVYFRDPGHQFHEHTDCVDADRSIDPKSGGQRFDLTPPSGLPPPPKN